MKFPSATQPYRVGHVLGKTLGIARSPEGMQQPVGKKSSNGVT